MTNEQLYLAIGVPLLYNTGLIALLIWFLTRGFASIDKRFDDAKEVWRAELKRVEEVLDPRLKHLEEGGR